MTTPQGLKHQVACEAATLLYFGAEKEYKQAKMRAAQTLGTHFLPSNLEVAMELEKISDENGGSKRKERLIEMRKEALIMMKLLDDYHPILIGSVWRGNIKQGSDIDIAVVTKKEMHLDLRKFEECLKGKISLYEIKLDSCEKEFLNNLVNGTVVYGFLRVFQ